MSLSEFVTWKFRNLEGKHEGFRSYELFTTKIERAGKTYYINYRVKEELCDIISEDDELFTKIENLPFNRLEETLRGMGFLVERNVNRHKSTYIKFIPKFERND